MGLQRCPFTSQKVIVLNRKVINVFLFHAEGMLLAFYLYIYIYIYFFFFF